ncbi:MAG: hypothetical protein U0359_14505 [Byssovorax sp.]
MAYVLVAVVGASAAIGAVQSIAGSSPSPLGSPASPAPTAAAAPAPVADDDTDQAPTAAAGPEITGEVLEVIDVPNYSYYRIGKKGTDGVWAAVPSAKLKVGDAARVGGAMRMENFKSSALNRTFPEIYFGTLAANGAPAGQPANPHGAGQSPHGAMGAMGADPHGGVDMQAAGADPHQGASKAPSAVDVKPVEKAAGPNGKTVAEVNGQRTALNGKTVRIRGTVVKSTPGVMGKTYLHLRDGSGDASAGTNDLTATTDATPAVGDTIVLEGTVVLDRDIGAGYKFATLVENGKIQP